MLLAIRPIEPKDNAHIEKLILDTLLSNGCSGEGFASADPELKNLYAAYQAPGTLYYILQDEAGHVAGGGGLAPLKGSTPQDAICEMQKLYFHPSIRGQGMGNALMSRLINDARHLGYKKIYIETIPEFKTAIHLYTKFGFVKLDTALGSTGHHKCDIHMLLTL